MQVIMKTGFVKIYIDFEKIADNSYHKIFDIFYYYMKRYEKY